MLTANNRDVSVFATFSIIPTIKQEKSRYKNIGSFLFRGICEKKISPIICIVAVTSDNSVKILCFHVEKRLILYQNDDTI